MPQANRLRLLKALTEFVPIVLAVGAIALAIGNLFDIGESARRVNLTTLMKEEIDVLAADQARLRKEAEEIHDQLSALTKSSGNGNPQAQVNALASALNTLNQRFSRVERAILQDPAKALEVPILRKDLERSQELTLTQIGALRQDIERTYSLITGTMIALALAVLAPALSNLFRKGRESAGSE